MKYINADKLITEIERRLKNYWKICFHDVKAYNEDSNVRELKDLLSFLDTLEESVLSNKDMTTFEIAETWVERNYSKESKEEKEKLALVFISGMAEGQRISPNTLEEHIKVYRVENETEQKGLWRKFDGTWEPLFDMLTDGRCRELPMEDNDVYRADGLKWFASAPSTRTLQKWFSKKDLEELTKAGFTINEFTVSRYKILSEYEYIFPRENILEIKQLSISDIYPVTLEESVSEDLEKEIDAYYKEWDGNNRYAQTARHFAKLGAEHLVDASKTISEDLVEEVKRYYSDNFAYIHSDAPTLSILTNIARHFYELGKNAK